MAEIHNNISILNKKGNNEKIYWICIEWHTNLHKKVDDALTQVTLGSIKAVRGFANTTAMDIFYWLSPKYKKKILNEVVSQMNEQFKIFMQIYPDFLGQISILAHSLGSVISYFMLSNQNRFDHLNIEGNVSYMRKHAKNKEDDDSEILVGECPQLNFEVENLFIIGSPLGMFLTVQGSELDKFHVPKCNYFFNIIHSSDPVSYRMEPWIDPKYKTKDPYPLKLKKHQESIEITDTNRFDYTLPPTKAQTLFEYTALFSAHSSYWKSKEVIHFIINNINTGYKHLPYSNS